MPRRSRVGLEEICELSTLSWAFWRAAKGKRDRREVAAMAEQLEPALELLAQDLRAGRAPQGRCSRFTVLDPKQREVMAPRFRDRVLHHAVMAHVGPVLDRGLIDESFACREGKGTHAAVRRAQHHCRRQPWFVKADVRAFFASIEHYRLLSMLRRRFKSPALLSVFARLLDRTPLPPGRGLPIGALFSQHFANAFLGRLDRFLREELRVAGYVRYMDDLVWWTRSKAEARASLALARGFAADGLGLEIKASARIGRSVDGVGFLGVRVLPGCLRLLRRRKRRYRAAVRRAERAWRAGELDSRALQGRLDDARSIVAHTDATAWTRQFHAQREPLDA